MAHGGTLDAGVAHFTVAQPTDIAALLDAASRDGLEVIDVVLRRPNLESVFLQLTGRDLRRQMIAAIVRNGFRSLRRDRGAMILSFVLPIAFFSIFGMIFGGMGGSGTPRVSVLVVDEDHSAASERLVNALLQEPSLDARTHAKTKKGEPVPADYTAATAETAVKQGEAPAALIIPKGFGAHPIAFGPGSDSAPIRLLHDSSDPVAAQSGRRECCKRR